MFDQIKSLVSNILDDGASENELEALRAYREQLKRSELSKSGIGDFRDKIRSTTKVGNRQRDTIKTSLEDAAERVIKGNRQQVEKDIALLESIGVGLEDNLKEVRKKGAESKGAAGIAKSRLDAINTALEGMEGRIAELKRVGNELVSGLNSQVRDIHGELERVMQEVRQFLEERKAQNRIQSAVTDRLKASLTPLEARKNDVQEQLGDAQLKRSRLSKKLAALKSQKERLKKKLEAGNEHITRLKLRFPERQRNSPTGFFRQFADLAYILYSKLKSMPDFAMVLGGAIGVGGVIGYFFL